MKTCDLEAEMATAVAAVTDDHRELLASYGVEAFVGVGLIGAALIRVEGDLYEPDPESGKLAFSTPVRVQHPATPESTVPDSYCRLGEIVDLVAWHPARPDRWALRTGAGEWLGCIEPQYMAPQPVAIRRSPLAWFRAGDGLVPLGRSVADIYRTLIWCQGGLIAEDSAHAAELRAIVERPWPALRVSIARQSGIADAAE